MNRAADHPLVVSLDGANVLSVLGSNICHFEIVTGSVQSKG
jgi:hypothetical protein